MMSSRSVNPNKCHLVATLMFRSWLQSRHSLDKSTTVKQLKRSIASAHFLLNPLRLIVHNATAGGILMEDEQKTLAHYGIHEGRTTQLDVMILPMSLKVRLRDFPGAETFILCNEFDTVEYLRHAIADRMSKHVDVRPEDLVLYYGPHRLSQLETTLNDYTIRETAVEVEVHKVAGGRVQPRPATSAL